MNLYRQYKGVTIRGNAGGYVVSCGLNKISTSSIIVALQYYSIFIMRLK
ncbi:UNVERIFIED_ORG: hypothetical protein [Escherichia phage CMSTMSU]